MADREELQARLLDGITEATKVIEAAPKPGDHALLVSLKEAAQTGQGDALCDLYLTAMWQAALRRAMQTLPDC